jgi:hypothetical protein
MVNSVDVTFRIPDLTNHLLMEASERQFPALLGYRLVSQLWKVRCENLLERLWDLLRASPPKGMVDISLKIRQIEEAPDDLAMAIEFKKLRGIEGWAPDEKCIFVKFKRLTDVFREHGAEIPVGSTAINIPQFQELQNKIDHDCALRAIWSSKLGDLIQDAVYRPPLDASAEEILAFLNDPINRDIHEEIIETVGLDLTTLPLNELRNGWCFFMMRGGANDIDAPLFDASAEEIREFLNDPTNDLVLEQITKLNLCELKLNAVPPELGRLTRLEELDLSHNQLGKVPNFSFPNLAYFTLTGNKLREVPPFDLPNLVVLHLSENELTELPPFNFSNLQDFNVSCNKLTKANIPFPNLTELDLRYNELNELPDLANCQQLTECNFEGNTPMLIPDGILLRFSEHHVIRSFVSQLNYRCESPLARLYQAIMKNKLSSCQIKTIFDSLGKEDRNMILEMVWEEAGKPGDDAPQWKDTHAFEDMFRFGLAVRKTIITKFERLSLGQRIQVHSEIHNLASRPPIPSEWGEEGSIVHLPRLADALSRSDQK